MQVFTEDAAFTSTCVAAIQGRGDRSVTTSTYINNSQRQKYSYSGDTGESSTYRKCFAIYRNKCPSNNMTQGLASTVYCSANRKSKSR